MKKNYKTKKFCRLSIKCSMLLCSILILGIASTFTGSVVYGQKAVQRFPLKLESVSVLDALREINRLSGNSVIFKKEEVEKETKRVTVDLKDVITLEAVRACLAGTKLSCTESDGKVVVIPEKEQKAKIVSGIISDASGQPLPGATVVVKGTASRIGTSANVNGEYQIVVPAGTSVLVYSFIGYKSKEVDIKEQTKINVTLEEDVKNVDEVVVVAYGTQNKRDVLGAMSTVNADDIKDIPSPSLANLLQGRVAGMSVINMTGAPGGGGTSISIRGFNSLSVEAAQRFSNPLWVIDGVPMYSFTSPVSGLNTLAEIDPKDIESVQVLKDAASASIYGSRAANGVILVTTKKGRFNQKAKVSVNVSQTWIFNPSLPDLMGGNRERYHRMEALRNYQEAGFSDEQNRYVYVGSYKEAYLRDIMYDYFWGKGNGAGVPLYQDSLNKFYNNSTNLFDYYFRTARVTDASLQLTGGAERVTYNFGLGYYSETGVLKGTGFNRMKLISNITVKPMDKMDANLRFYLAYTDRSRSSEEMNTYSFNTGTDLEQIPKELLVTSTLYPGGGTPAFDEATKRFRGTKEKNDSYRARASFDASYEFIKGLSFKTSVALDYSQQNVNIFLPSNLNDYNESYSSGQIERYMMLLNENMFTYKRSFAENHNVDFLVGLSLQSDETNKVGGYGYKAPSDLIHYVPWYGGAYDVTSDRQLKEFLSKREKSTMVGVFGRLNYNYMQKYLLSFSLRRDGSSKFGEDVRWATFPAYAVGYAFSEEPFMDWAENVLDYAKIRLSYGKSGKQFSQPYIALGLLEPAASFLGNPTVNPEWNEGLFNPTLTWEETDQYDFGLDLDLFNYRLNVVLDYYYRYTDKLLYNVTLPGNYSGYIKQWQNAYAISNEGIELQIKWDILRRDNLKWDMTFNIARNWNRLEKSLNGVDFQTYGEAGYFDSNVSVIGKPLNGLYVYKDKGYYNSDEEVPYIYEDGRKIYLRGDSYRQYYRAGDRILMDMDGNGSVATSWPLLEDRVYAGSPLPKASGGIISTLNWKGFDVNMLFSYVLGRHILNAGKGASVGTSLGLTLDDLTKPVFADLDKVTFWQQPGDKADFPVNRLEAGLGNFTTILSSNVENVSYLKLKTLTIGYTLPQKWTRCAGMESVRVFISGENLFTITNYTGPDPESVDVVTGVDNFGNYPLSTRVTLGLTLNF